VGEVEEKSIYTKVLEKYYLVEGEVQRCPFTANYLTRLRFDWNAVAKSYVGSFWHQFSPSQLCFQIAGRHSRRKKVLDLCCGLGDLSLLCAEDPHNESVLAVDVSSEMLNEFQHEKIVKKELDVGQVENRREAYGDDNFSHILSCISINFVENLDQVLEDMYKLLSDSGILVICVWGKREDCSALKNLEKSLDSKVNDLNFIFGEVKDLAKMIKNAGFEIVDKHTEPLFRQSATVQDIQKGYDLAARMRGLEAQTIPEEEFDLKNEKMSINVVVAQKKRKEKVLKRSGSYFASF
jgi:ubiquinone/menaquinone biosynthesis C-methylase UbiE